MTGTDDTDLDDAAEATEGDVKTIIFDPPIKHRQASYDQMVLTEPTGKQVRQAEALLRQGVNVDSLRRYQILLVSLVAKWPEDVVEMLPIRKLDEAGRFLERFTLLGQPIGKS